MEDYSISRRLTPADDGNSRGKAIHRPPTSLTVTTRDSSLAKRAMHVVAAKRPVAEASTSRCLSDRQGRLADSPSTNWEF